MCVAKNGGHCEIAILIWKKQRVFLPYGILGTKFSDEAFKVKPRAKSDKTSPNFTIW